MEQQHVTFVGEVADEDKALLGTTIAILATDGFEYEELVESRGALTRAGAETVVVAPFPGQITGMKSSERAGSVEVDVTLDRARADDFDALLVPGGALSPDSLRTIGLAVEFVRSFSRQDKLIATLSQAASALIEAELVRGRKVTSWPSLKTDLRNAGATWVDRDVVVDGRLLTGRTVPALVEATVSELCRRRATRH